MNRTEFNRQIAARLRTEQGILLSPQQTAQVLDTVLDEMMHVVASGEDLSLHPIGKLKPVYRRAHPGRDPRDGSVITVPSRTDVRMAPSKSFRVMLAELTGRTEAAM